MICHLLHVIRFFFEDGQIDIICQYKHIASKKEKTSRTFMFYLFSLLVVINVDGLPSLDSGINVFAKHCVLYTP